MEETKYKAVRVNHRETGDEIVVCNICAKNHSIIGDVVLITNQPSTVNCAEPDCGVMVYKVTSS